MTETTVVGALDTGASSRPEHGVRRARCLRETAYLVAGLPLSTAAFVVVVAGLAGGLSTLFVWVGLPILVLTLRAGRGLAGVERRATVAVSGRALPTHHYRTNPGGGLALRAQLTDPQLWRDLLHALTGFPVRVAGAVITVSWILGGLGGLTYVGWEWALPHAGRYRGLFELVTGNGSRIADVVATTVLGALMLLTFPLVTRALTRVRAGLARGLLTSQSASLRARADELVASRRAAVNAEAQTLHRVERDLHDGPQQRLVRLGMDLETLGRRLDDDPSKARALLSEALAHNREALAEIRALSRGIAPPILADRGLTEAVTAAAARCPVPTTLDIRLPHGPRPAPAVETTAYFVVTEALTNLAKHSAARRAGIVIGVTENQMTVQVGDDGRGGAHLGKGRGLAGLADRLATVEGGLNIASPAGGPTIVSATIPLAGVGQPSEERTR